MRIANGKSGLWKHHPAILSTFAMAFALRGPTLSPFVILGRSRSASELRRPEDPCQSIAAVPAVQNRLSLCTVTALPLFLRHGS